MAVDEIGTKPDEIGTTWAEDDPTPYPAIFPPASKTDVGYQPEGLPLPEDPGEIIDAKWWNGIVQYLFQAVNWLSAGHRRAFETVAGGIAATEPPASFIVEPPAAGLRKPWGEQWHVLNGTAVPVDGVAADGQYIWYATGTKLYAADPETGALLGTWPGTPPPGAHLVTTDGLYVYYVDADLRNQAEIVDRSNGATVGALLYHATNKKIFSCLAANGYHAVAVYEDDAINDDHGSIWRDVGTTPIKVGDFSNGTGTNSLYACAMDHELAFVGGVEGSDGASVRAMKLSDATQLWGVAIASGMIVRGIATDGELVYVACDSVSIGGSTSNVFALDRLTGSLIWTKDILAFTDADYIACDDRHLYVSGGASGSELTIVLLKHIASYVDQVSDRWVRAVDGVSIYVTAGVDTLARHYRGGPSREFQRAAAADRYRRPFHKLAIPTQGG